MWGGTYASINSSADARVFFLILKAAVWSYPCNVCTFCIYVRFYTVLQLLSARWAEAQATQLIWVAVKYLNQCPLEVSEWLKHAEHGSMSWSVCFKGAYGTGVWGCLCELGVSLVGVPAIQLTSILQFLAEMLFTTFGYLHSKDTLRCQSNYFLFFFY